MPGLSNTTSPTLELVKTALDNLRDNTLLTEAVVGKATALDPVVFNQDTSTKAAEVTSVLGGGGYFKKTVTGQAQDYSNTKISAKNVPAPKVTIMAEFKKDLPISRTFMADDQQSAVAKSVKQETLAWVASRDQNAFNPYGQGFVTTTYTTIDGVALFSNSHINANGDTVDNLETGALSDTTLNNCVISLRGQLNQTGILIGWEPKFVLCSSTNHHDGMIVAKSVLRAGTGSNDLNYFSELYPGAKVVYSPFLDAASTTAFFVGGSMHGVVRWERESFFSKLVDWSTDPDDAYRYKMRAREEVDAIEYVGLVGNTGA